MIELNQGIALLSGAMFDYNNPEKSNVQIEDIATALSNVCRFAGHVHYFYSVAQHSVNASRIVIPEYAFDALMHDTAEAFTNDLPTPLKAAFPVFKELEIRIESAMSKKFHFEYPMSPSIKLADLQMLRLEKETVKKDFTEWGLLQGIQVEHLKKAVDLRPMTPNRARAEFLDRYYELTMRKAA